MNLSRRVLIACGLISIFPIFNFLKNKKSVKIKKIGLGLDESSNLHNMPGHLENSYRITQAIQEIKRSNLFQEFKIIKPGIILEEDILKVHSLNYYKQLEKSQNTKSRFLHEEKWSPYINKYSFEAAKNSASIIYELSEKVWVGELESGFALTRPPGHHAEHDKGRGFCLLNNTAIAIEKLKAKFSIKKIAVIDLDVDHGNGTQNYYYNNPEVHYSSIHQSPFWPYTGDEKERGFGAGIGATLNIPMPAGTGDLDVINAFKKKITPELIQFQPELIFVSVGYDLHRRDPLGLFKMSLKGIYELHKEVIQLSEKLCNKKIIFNLEGGYNSLALSHGITNTLKILLDRNDIKESISES